MRRFPFNRPVGFDVAVGWKVNDGNFKLPLDARGQTFAQIEDFYLLQHLAHDAEKQIANKWDVTSAHLLRAQNAIEADPKDLYVTFTSAVGDRKLDETEDVTPRVCDNSGLDVFLLILYRLWRSVAGPPTVSTGI